MWQRAVGQHRATILRCYRVAQCIALVIGLVVMLRAYKHVVNVELISASSKVYNLCFSAIVLYFIVVYVLGIPLSTFVGATNNCRLAFFYLCC